MPYRPRANPNRGPGDFLPPDEPELGDAFIDEARDMLENEREDDDEPITEDAVLERAWRLQEQAHRECLEAEAEMRAWEAEDRDY